MPKTIRYIGTQNYWPEVAYTGRPTRWMPGMADECPDNVANALLATGFFRGVLQSVFLDSVTRQAVDAAGNAIGGGAPIVISGVPAVGNTLTATISPGWRNSGGNWTRDGSNISGATALTYPLVSADNDKDVTYASSNIPYTPPALRIGAATPVAPGAPTIGTATAGDGVVNVVFTAPASTGGSPILEYQAELSNANLATGAASPIPVSSANGAAVTGRVRARNAVDWGPWSANSNSVTPSAGASLPGAPTIGVATGGDGSASVAGTAPASNGGASIDKYRAVPYIGSTAGTPVESATLPVAVSGLVNGQAYTFKLQAHNSVGWGPESAASNTVTPTAAATVPAAPAAPVATAGDGTVSLAFTAPSNGGSAILEYGALLSNGNTNTGNPTGSPVSVTSANGAAVTGQVRARNAVGWGPYSPASNSVMPLAAGTPMPEPAVQSMLLGAKQLATRVSITDNGNGTYTGTDGTGSMVASLSTPTATPHLAANADGWTGIEYRGSDVAVCLSTGVSQNFTGGRWLVLRSTGVYYRDGGVETLIEAIGAVGTRYRIERQGTALQIRKEDSATSAWSAPIYTFAATISATVALHAVYRTSNGVIKPMNRYGIAKATQSQWIEPGFLTVGGSTFVSTAGEAGEIKLTKLAASMLRGATQVLATIPPPDDHNRDAHIDALSGKIVAAYTGHNESAFYTNTSASVGGLDFLPQVVNDVTPNTVSYAQLFRAPGQDRIWRMHRDRGALNGRWNCMYSDNEGASWQGAVQIAALPYQWGVADETGNKIWITAYNHPTGGTPNNVWRYGFDLLTGDVLATDGTIINNVLSGSGTPRMPTASMQVIAASTDPGTLRLCDVREGNGTTGRAMAIIRFNKGAANTGPELRVARWVDNAQAYAETVVRGAGPAFHFDSAYYPAHCFGADTNTVYTAYSTSTGLGGADQVHVLRAYTWDSGTSGWVAGPVLRQITGIIARPRYHNGYLYWSELDSYATSGSFSFAGDFCWLAV